MYGRMYGTVRQFTVSASRSNVAKLQKVPNFSARVISGRRKYDHVSDVISDLAWLRVPEMISYFELSLMHGILTFGKPDLPCSWFTFNHEHLCRDTRQSRHLYKHHLEDLYSSA